MLNLSSIKSSTRISRWMERLRNRWTGRSGQLQYLFQFIGCGKIIDQHFVGRRQVSLSQIIGSANLGRSRDFDSQFRLRHERGRERMEDVARAWRQKKLPPVALIQVGEHYFVQDGHHRVAISKANQQEKISANVILIELEPPTPKSKMESPGIELAIC